MYAPSSIETTVNVGTTFAISISELQVAQAKKEIQARDL
jgi:hypothetical protein